MKQRSGLSGLRVRIRVGGQLDADWSSWFDGLSVTSLPGGETSIHGTVADQSSLHGLLSRIRDLGVPLLALEVTGPTDVANSAAASSNEPERSERRNEPQPGSRPD